MKKLLSALVAAGLVVAAAAVYWPAEACVGKSLFLGRLPGKEQEVLAEIFSWLVSERTGTTVAIKEMGDSRSAHDALQKADLDLYLEDQGVAMREILGMPVPGNGGELRSTLRKEYEQRFNLIWLEPWGVTGGTAQLAGPATASTPTLVAPVIRKDTLKKFPALSRLVNKLAGQVDDDALARLVKESERRPAREVVKQFLKDRKLI